MQILELYKKYYWKTFKIEYIKNSGNSVVLNEIHNFPKTNPKILDIGCVNGDIDRNLNNLNCIIDGITISEQEAINSMNVMGNVLIFNL